MERTTAFGEPSILYPAGQQAQPQFVVFSVYKDEL